jgi:SPP1 family predicted phage head-tail adaptor
VNYLEAGKLNQRITIQQYTPTRDTNGAEIDTWGTVTTVWASKSNQSGREFSAAQKVNAEVTALFTIRYRTGINTSMRILHESKYYNILFIDNVESANVMLRIAAKGVV